MSLTPQHKINTCSTGSCIPFNKTYFLCRFSTKQYLALYTLLSSITTGEVYAYVREHGDVIVPINPSHNYLTYIHAHIHIHTHCTVKVSTYMYI